MESPRERRKFDLFLEPSHIFERITFLLQTTKFSLHFPSHPVIGQHNRHHRLGHGNESRNQTRIVPSSCAYRGEIPFIVDGLLLAGNTAGWFDGCPQDDGHPAGDSPQHSSVPICRGGDFRCRLW